MSDSLCIPYRKNTPRPAWTPPKASGRFAFLEMEDRRKMRVQQQQPTSREPDPHRPPSIRLLEAWAPVEDNLRQAVDSATFRIWLALLHPHALTNGVWRLAHRPEGIGWVRDRFGRLIEGCAGRPVEFVVCEELA